MGGTDEFFFSIRMAISLKWIILISLENSGLFSVNRNRKHKSPRLKTAWGIRVECGLIAIVDIAVAR
ncbi:hypothetical protein ACX27_05230 [Nostoc piscinale CENA21]|uniref:Uncharacterized protein n=1 Tax=Nostoc piscinale CENA21 TaxID=224013 RepID=A0A0M3V4R3_9NOSO|nr:hypothetical protein ACX27_05230 [Nostoc piscinale CENA21]